MSFSFHTVQQSRVVVKKNEKIKKPQLVMLRLRFLSSCICVCVCARA